MGLFAGKTVNLADLLPPPTPPLIRCIEDLCHQHGFTLREWKCHAALYQVEFTYVCPHGYESTNQVTYELIATATSLADLAEALFAELYARCKKGHPAGPPLHPNTAYSVPSIPLSPPEQGFSYEDLVEMSKLVSQPVPVKMADLVEVTAKYESALNDAVAQYMKNMLLYGSSTVATGPPPVVRELAEVVPALETAEVSCPAIDEEWCGRAGPEPLARVIVHLNDKHRWSRERIADWLDTLPIDLTLQPASTGD